MTPLARIDLICEQEELYTRQEIISTIRKIVAEGSVGVAQASANLATGELDNQETDPAYFAASPPAALPAGETERLRKGIQDYLDGNYPHARRMRAEKGAQARCAHGLYYYEDCGSCIDEHFLRLLTEDSSLPSTNSGDAA